MMLTALGWLARADLASAPAAVQAQCLRGLERAHSVHAAARARALAAFTAQGGYELDGQGSPRTWLTWQTRITRPAACASLASMRRLQEHPAIAAALAGGALSTSWARQIAAWTGQLPEEHRADADVILLAAAAGGADLDGLAGLAEEIRRRTARPDTGPGDGFEDRALRLATTLGGAGRLHADLTPAAAAALQAVLDTLGKKAGPEDTRTPAQRRHDALEQGCRLLLGAGACPTAPASPSTCSSASAWTTCSTAPGADPPRPERSSPPPGPATTATPPSPPSSPAASTTTCSTSSPPASPAHRRPAGRNRPGPRIPGPDRPGRLRPAPPRHPPRRVPGPGQGRCPAADPRQRHRAALRTRRPRRPAAHRHPAPPRRLHQPAPGHRRHHRDHPPAPAPRDHHPRPALRRPRLRPATTRLPRPPHHPPQPRRHHQPDQLPPALPLPPPHPHPPWDWTITLHPDGTTTLTSPDGRMLRSHSPPTAAA